MDEKTQDIHLILEKCKDLMEREIDKLIERQRGNKEKSLKFSEGKIITEYTKTLQGLSKNRIIDEDKADLDLASTASSNELIEIAKTLLEKK